MGLYEFYFDETFHTQKVTYRNNELNIKKEDDFYVGCYIGSCEWNQIESDLIDLEEKYKPKYGIPKENELKSTSLIKKNKIPYGVCSLKSTTIAFYTELLEILNNHVKIHFSILNKYEFFIRNILPDIRWFEEHGVIYKSFIYSFIKFTILHQNYQICEILLSEKTSNEKKRELVAVYEKHLLKINNIDKKRSETQTVKMFIKIFDELPVFFCNDNIFPWDYTSSLKLFHAFLCEQNIGITHLYIDEEQKTLEASKKIFKNKTSALKSHESIQIRVCDWVACLLSRLILSYSNDYKNIEGCEDLSETKHLLDSKFFNFNDSKKLLIKRMKDVLLTQQEGYWSTSGSVYNDGTTIFYAFLEYCNYSFENNEKPQPDIFNTYLSIKQNEVFDDLVNINFN